MHSKRSSYPNRAVILIEQSPQQNYSKLPHLLKFSGYAIVIWKKIDCSGNLMDGENATAVANLGFSKGGFCSAEECKLSSAGS